MSNIEYLGQIFFAVGFIGLGITHFIFGDFMTGRAPAWPETVSGGLTWAYITGVVFILTSVSVLTGIKTRYAAVITGILIFVWALLRHIPVVAATSFLSGEWTGAGKALTFFGGALAVAGTLKKETSGCNTSLLKFINLQKEFIILGRCCLGIFLIITGIQHFMFTEFVASLIPGWFPEMQLSGPISWVWP